MMNKTRDAVSDLDKMPIQRATSRTLLMAMSMDGYVRDDGAQDEDKHNKGAAVT